MDQVERVEDELELDQELGLELELVQGLALELELDQELELELAEAVVEVEVGQELVLVQLKQVSFADE